MECCLERALIREIKYRVCSSAIRLLSKATSQFALLAGRWVNSTCRLPTVAVAGKWLAHRKWTGVGLLAHPTMCLDIPAAQWRHAVAPAIASPINDCSLVPGNLGKGEAVALRGWETMNRPGRWCSPQVQWTPENYWSPVLQPQHLEDYLGHCD